MATPLAMNVPPVVGASLAPPNVIGCELLSGGPQLPPASEMVQRSPRVSLSP